MVHNNHILRLDATVPLHSLHCNSATSVATHSTCHPLLLLCCHRRIAKNSLFRVPFFGWVLAGWGHYSIDRSNVESAKQSLAHAASQIHRYQRCLAISAEGTRSKTGRLQDFKKGPFHTAIAVRLPVIPVCIMGAYQLWPPAQMFPVSGNVVVRMLPAMTVREGETHKELSGRVRRAMLRAIAEPMGRRRRCIRAVLCTCCGCPSLWR